MFFNHMGDFTHRFDLLGVGRTPNSERIRDDEVSDGDCNYSGDEGTVCSEGSWEKITKSETVEMWKSKLLVMRIDLSTRCGDFIDQMETNDPAKWFAACCMETHKDFTSYRTDDLAIDIEDYVKCRLVYVLDCLRMINGVGDRQYVKDMYIDRWDSDINDRWQWISLLAKWRAQFDYMQRDLIKLFGSKQEFQNSLGNPEECKHFRLLLFLDDDNFEDVDDPDCTIDYCTNVDCVVSFVKKTIDGIIIHLRKLQTGRDGHYITIKYVHPFIKSICDDSEWETLINVKSPSTETLFY